MSCESSVANRTAKALLEVSGQLLESTARSLFSDPYPSKRWRTQTHFVFEGVDTVYFSMMGRMEAVFYLLSQLRVFCWKVALPLPDRFALLCLLRSLNVYN
jgi:hypothetical protein